MSVSLLCVKRKEQMLSAEFLGSVPSCECRDAVESSSYFERFLPLSRNCGRLWFRTWGKISSLTWMSELLVKHKPKNKHMRDRKTQPCQICLVLLSCMFLCSAHTILVLYTLWKTGTSRRYLSRETAFLSVLIPRCVSFLKLCFPLLFFFFCWSSLPFLVSSLLPVRMWIKVERNREKKVRKWY